MKYSWYFSFLLFMLFSCSSDKVTFSPMNELLTDNSLQPINRNFREKSDLVFYASELTNHLSTIPRFKNTVINKEINSLRRYVKDYLYSIEHFGEKERQKNLTLMRKSYLKIQKNRKFLNSNEDEIINRYMFRLKNNIIKLETLLKSESSSLVDEDES